MHRQPEVANHAPPPAGMGLRTSTKLSSAAAVQLGTCTRRTVIWAGALMLHPAASSFILQSALTRCREPQGAS